MQFNLASLIANNPKSANEMGREQESHNANLEKIKALIEQTNLGNQESKLKMPFVVPHQQADIRKVLANAANLEAETKYVPTKYGIQGMNAQTALKNYLLNAQRYNPERLTARDQLIKSQIDKIRNDLSRQNPSLNELGVPEQKNEQQGQEGQPQNPQNPQNPQQQGEGQPEGNGAPRFKWDESFIGKETKEKANRWVDKETGTFLVPYDKSEKEMLGKQSDAFSRASEILPELIESGKKFSLGGPGYFQSKANANEAAKYNSLLAQMTETVIPTFKNAPRVQKLLTKINDVLARAPFETSKGYDKRMQDLMSDYQEQKEKADSAYRVGGRIIPPKKDSKYYPKYINKLKTIAEHEAGAKFPTFKNHRAETIWVTQQPDKVRNAYMDFSNRVHGNW